MTHKKHTTIVEVKSDDRFLYIATIIGPNPDVHPHMHKMPKLTLTYRAAEYNLDVEDPLALDLVLREHHYAAIDGTNSPSYEKNRTHPLFYLPSIEEACTFMEDRIEEVRVDRKAPDAETGCRMLAGAVKEKQATKGLMQVRDKLLLAYDPRVTEPIQYYRDLGREKIRDKGDPVANFLRVYNNDKLKREGV